MSARVFILQPPPHQARRLAAQFLMDAPDGTAVRFSDVTRSLEQNAAQWPILEAFSKQLQWPVNGQLVWMSAEEWKDVLTAAFEREGVRLAQAFDGAGVVMLGQRTSQYGKKRFSEWLEFLHAAAADRGVVVYPDERPQEQGVAYPKDAPVRSEAYRRLVAQLPCRICGRADRSQAAHPNTGKGLATKTDDRLCFPLCADAPGERGCHSLFDQGALFQKDQRRELERAWGADTRRRIELLGQWPQGLPRWSEPINHPQEDRHDPNA